MGLASSQARLLNLTSRMHQIEYNAARLEAMKLQMANESRQVYLEYQDALEKTKVQMKTLTQDGAVTYVDITNYKSFVDAGFALVYKDKVYTGESDLHTILSLIAKDTNPSATDTATIGNGTTHFEAALTNVINSGYVTIMQKDVANNKWWDNPTEPQFTDFLTSVATNTGLQEITDETGLRKAEAKYEADMKRIDMKDRKYDYDLAALEEERNAIKQEMETLKTVAKDNVDRTFKLFS